MHSIGPRISLEADNYVVDEEDGSIPVCAIVNGEFLLPSAVVTIITLSSTATCKKLLSLHLNLSALIYIVQYMLHGTKQYSGYMLWILLMLFLHTILSSPSFITQFLMIM